MVVGRHLFFDLVDEDFPLLFSARHFLTLAAVKVFLIEQHKAINQVVVGLLK